MLTITRKDLLLTIDSGIIPSMGSSDVPLKFVNDTETYVDFLIEPRVGYYINGCPKSGVCEYDTSSNIIKIPAEAFKNKGILVIAIALVDNGDSNHIEVTKELTLEVTPAPNGTVILPATDTWQTAVNNLVEQLYNQDYKPLYDQALEDINEAVQTANTASQNATDALDEANETNQLINGKIEDGSFIPDISMTAVSGDTTSIERTGTKEAPVFNLTIEKGQDGEGQTTVRKDGVIQENLSLLTEREENPTYAVVQFKDKDGNVIAVETSLDNVFIKSKDGLEEINAETILTNLYTLAYDGLYTSSPKTIFDELEKFF